MIHAKVWLEAIFSFTHVVESGTTFQAAQSYSDKDKPVSNCKN